MSKHSQKTRYKKSFKHIDKMRIRKFHGEWYDWKVVELYYNSPAEKIQRALLGEPDPPKETPDIKQVIAGTIELLAPVLSRLSKT